MNPETDATVHGAIVRVSTAALGVGLSSAALVAFGTQRRDIGVVCAFLGGMFTLIATIGAAADAERNA